MAHRFKVQKDGPYPHFVTCSIVRWLPIFISGPYFGILANSLRHMRAHRDLSVHGYVFMPTHMHAIVTARQDDLSEVMRDFKRFTSKMIHEQAITDGQRLWQ